MLWSVPAESTQRKRVKRVESQQVAPRHILSIPIWKLSIHLVLTIALLTGGVGLLGTLQRPLLAESQPRPVGQVTQGILAVVGGQGADLYDLPDGILLESLTPGATLTAAGRTADGLWISVVSDEYGEGWVDADELVIFGAEQLPVISNVPDSASPQATESPREEGADDATDSAVTPDPTATPPPSPTATFSPTPVPPTPTPVPPTATPVPPTPTPMVSSLLGNANELVAVVGSDGATLYPELGATAGTPLAIGTALTAVERTADNQMLYVSTSTGEMGWVMTAEVVVFNTQMLPVRGDMVDSGTAESGSVDSEAMDSEAVDSRVEESPVEQSPVASTSTPTVVPTVTNTSLPTATPTRAMRPTPQADGRPTARVAMSGSRLNIRSGPNTQFPIIGKALPQEIFIARGRNGDSTWVQLMVSDISGGFGWVSSRFVVLSDPIADLPISLETNDAAAPDSATIAQRLATNPVAANTTTNRAETRTTTPSQQSAPAGLVGRLVIQTEWGGTFYVYDLSSGSLQPLTGGLDPAFSPDGNTIAFTRIGGDAGGVYLIDSNGSNERRIYKAQEQLMAPKWSPDGDFIVFSRSDGTYTCNEIAFVGCIPDGAIFPVPPGGLPPALEEVRDDVLNEFERTSRPNWQISRINPEGKEYRDLPALNSARAPDWTDAGIVYQSGGGIQITQDTPDGDTRPVYRDGWDWDPDWQPGGGRIVFQSKEGPRWEIFAVNPDGTGLTALTRPVTTLVDEMPSNVSPVWSPDGQYIAFLSNRTEDHEAGPWRVWVMNGDGSNQRPLPINLEIQYGYAGEQMVSWGL